MAAIRPAGPARVTDGVEFGVARLAGRIKMRGLRNRSRAKHADSQKLSFFLDH